MQSWNRILFFAFLAVLLGAGIVVVVRSGISAPSGDTPSPVPSGSISVSPSPSYFPDDISRRIPECSLAGTIEYTGQALRNRETFSYDKVDDPHDLILWKVTPEGENFSIGPNRFSTLTLPKGQETLTVGFSAPPQKKEYRLTASIQYPYFVNGQVEILTKDCSGSIRLIVL